IGPEAPGHVAVADRGRSAEAAAPSAGSERKVELSEGEARRERRASADQAPAALDPAAEGKVIGDAATIPSGETRATGVVEALGTEAVAAHADLRRVVGQPAAEE